jgi:hypothetical protein
MNARGRRLAPALILAAAALAGPPDVVAQAWLPPQGEASLTLGYQYYRSTDVILVSGVRFYDGLIQQHAGLGYLTYGITDRLAVSVGLPPYFLSSYQGPDPHTWPVMDGDTIARDPSGRALFHPPTIDDGSYHGSFQDFAGQLSYMALRGPWVVTPFVGFQVPSHGYDYHAQTAVGRRLWELRIGASVGGHLDSILPNAYVQGRYAFAYRQAMLDLRFNYSFVDLEVGYFVTPSLSLRILGSGQIAHDGLRQLPFDEGQPDIYTLSQWVYISSEGEQALGQPALPVALHHDQLGYSTSYNLGAGASFAVTPSLDVSAQVFKAVHARGMRPTELAVSVWTTVTFPKLFGKKEHP